MTHPDDRIRRLLRDCPFLIDRVDLSEGSYSIMGETPASLRDARFSDAEVAPSWAAMVGKVWQFDNINFYGLAF
jgi:hypothetical protein